MGHPLYFYAFEDIYSIAWVISNAGMIFNYIMSLLNVFKPMTNFLVRALHACARMFALSLSIYLSISLSLCEYYGVENLNPQGNELP